MPVRWPNPRLDEVSPRRWSDRGDGLQRRVTHEMEFWPRGAAIPLAHRAQHQMFSRNLFCFILAGVCALLIAPVAIASGAVLADVFADLSLPMPTTGLIVACHGF